ncbi:MAG: hypothetical protein ABI369_06615 [Acetobacteraceae bacterium]
MKTFTAAMLVGLIGLGGCASIVGGSTQSLSVTAVANGNDVAGAQCTLTNDKGVWYVSTPGSLAVHRSYGDMNVKCSKEGYAANVASVPSSTKAMAFGNILFGGLIGAGIDMSTGAAYDYPSPITVHLTPAATTTGLASIPTS